MDNYSITGTYADNQCVQKKDVVSKVKIRLKATGETSDIAGIVLMVLSDNKEPQIVDANPWTTPPGGPDIKITESEILERIVNLEDNDRIYVGVIAISFAVDNMSCKISVESDQIEDIDSSEPFGVNRTLYDNQLYSGPIFFTKKYFTKSTLKDCDLFIKLESFDNTTSTLNLIFEVSGIELTQNDSFGVIANDFVSDIRIKDITSGTYELTPMSNWITATKNSNNKFTISTSSYMEGRYGYLIGPQYGSAKWAQLVTVEQKKIDVLPYADDLICYLDASKQSDGDTTLTDFSGNGANFTLVGTSVSGPSVSFYPDNSYGYCDNIKTCSNGYTVFFRRLYTEIVRGSCLMAKRINNGDVGEFELDYITVAGQHGFFSYGDISYNSIICPTDTKAITVYQTSEKYVSNMGENTVPQVSSTANRTSYRCVLGAVDKALTYKSKYYFYKLAIYNRVLSDTEIEEVLNKFGGLRG